MNILLYHANDFGPRPQGSGGALGESVMKCRERGAISHSFIKLSLMSKRAPCSVLESVDRVVRKTGVSWLSRS